MSLKRKASHGRASSSETPMPNPKAFRREPSAILDPVCDRAASKSQPRAASTRAMKRKASYDVIVAGEKRLRTPVGDSDNESERAETRQIQRRPQGLKRARSAEDDGTSRSRSGSRTRRRAKLNTDAEGEKGDGALASQMRRKAAGGTVQEHAPRAKAPVIEKDDIAAEVNARLRLREESQKVQAVKRKRSRNSFGSGSDERTKKSRRHSGQKRRAELVIDDGYSRESKRRRV